MRSDSWTAVAALFALAALPLAGCGEAAAAPLEVTYYYLPG